MTKLATHSVFLTGAARLEHVSMLRLYKDCQNDKSWKDITMLVFDGDCNVTTTPGVVQT